MEFYNNISFSYLVDTNAFRRIYISNQEQFLADTCMSYKILEL